MIKFFEKLLGLIYTQQCYFCRSTKYDTLICPECRKKIHFLPESVFLKINSCCVYTAVLYDDIIKRLIKGLKYNNKKQLAKLHAEIMYEYWKKLNINDNFIIIPVPIHKSRLKERKYNHMDLVAEEFKKYTNYNISKNFLIRVKDTKKQYNLHKDERIKNLKNAFEINEKNLIDKEAKLLIIDDIISTGATIGEIIKILKEKGYNNITAFTLSTPDIWN